MNGDPFGSLLQEPSVCAQLAGGAVFCIRNSKTIPTVLYIDVNGKQEPNVYGRDLFAMCLLKDGSLKYEGCILPLGDNYVEKIVKAGWKMNY